jgi:TetR/AcrR family transcriptional repressor of nem operon
LVDRSDKSKGTEFVEDSKPETRERILQVALGLFCEKGYAAVGTQDICKAASVMKGSLYHFFPSKQEVALAALALYGESVREQMERIARSPGTPRERLGRLFETIRDQARGQQKTKGVIHGCLHGHLAMELAATEPRAREALAAVTESWIQALLPVFREWLGPRQVAEADLIRTAQAVLAYLHGVVLVAKSANDPELITTLAQQFLPLLDHYPSTLTA